VVGILVRKRVSRKRSPPRRSGTSDRWAGVAGRAARVNRSGRQHTSTRSNPFRDRLAPTWMSCPIPRSLTSFRWTERRRQAFLSSAASRTRGANPIESLRRPIRSNVLGRLWTLHMNAHRSVSADPCRGARPRGAMESGWRARCCCSSAFTRPSVSEKLNDQRLDITSMRWRRWSNLCLDPGTLGANENFWKLLPEARDH